MADDVNVVLSVTERGFDKVAKDVAALRRELQDLGVDMSGIEKRLGSMEKSTAKGARASRDAAKANRDQANSAKANADSTNAQGAAADGAAAKNKKLADSVDQTASPTTRYALYDVANAYAVMGTAMAGAAVYAAVVGAQFEAAFTNVERTLQTNATSAEIDAIRGSLVQLSGQIPLTFQELSSIATIGNQMGIAKESVVDFTGTIARFSSVAGVSIEETTKAFGGFMAQTGLAPQYLENLGSAIAKVGIDSNATETQILALMREIAAGGVGAGFTADQIVGLAGTFASLQIAPERARGSLDTYFGTLTKAVANGGEDLQNFATVIGVTTDELERMVRSGEGADVLRGFLEGLNQAGDSVELQQALEALGLTQLRVSNSFRRLSNDLSLFDRDQQNAQTAFMEGAELNRQYAMTIDDLASQWTIFINGVNALVEAVSGGATPTLAALFAQINNVIFALAEWIDNNSFVAGIIAMGVAVMGIYGAMVLFRAMLLAGTAAVYAMRTAVAQMGGTALAAAGTMRGFAGALIGVGGAARGAAGSVNLLKFSIRGLLASTGIGLVVGLLGMGAEAMMNSGNKAESAALSIGEYNNAMKGMQTATAGGAGGADDLAKSLGGGGSGGGGGGGGGVAGAAEKAAEKVRTLVDYVNDLNGVFRRSSDLRFGSTEAMDEITLKWIKMNEEIEKYQQEVRSLTADRKLKQYWLDIANSYDDQIRASQLREEIAEIDDDLAKANAGASTELKGNSKAAIENRKTMRDLLGSYEDYIAALSAAGYSQEQIQKIIGNLNSDFTKQATALGFSGNELGTYQARFRDLSTVIEKMPRNVNVGFNANPALQALGEFFAKAEEQARIAGQNAGDAFGDGMGGGGGGGGIGGGFPDDWLTKEMQPPTEKAFNWWKGFWDGDPRVHKPIEDFFLGIGEAIRAFFTETIPAWIKGGQDWVLNLGIGIGNEVNNFFDDVINGRLIGPAAVEMKQGGVSAGLNFGSGVNNGARSGLTSSGAIRDWMNRQNPYNNGYNAGLSTGGGLMDGLTAALGGRKVGVAFSRDGYSVGGYVSGYASGGYTGSGHWLQPAGVVHKGEYVVPKKHVNQSTGLPDARYMMNLQRSTSAPRGGYAGGGHVGGGGFPSVMELGPASLGAIVNGLSVRLNVGRDQLAKAVSSGNERLSWTGSN